MSTLCAIACGPALKVEPIRLARAGLRLLSRLAKLRITACTLVMRRDVVEQAVELQLAVVRDAVAHDTPCLFDDA